MENNAVNHPAHYCQGGVECIDAIEAATTNLTGIEAVCTANVIKYLWRWKQKNGAQDLAKASWYLDKLIAKVGVEQVLPAMILGADEKVEKPEIDKPMWVKADGVGTPVEMPEKGERGNE